MKGIVLLSAALLVVVAFSSLTTADHLGDERSATFVGSIFVGHDLNEACADALNEPECPTGIPRGLGWVTCDGGDGHFLTAGLYDGIGAVKFCDVRHGAFVHLEFGEFTEAFGASGIVICPTYPYGTMELGRMTQEEPLDAEVPYQCESTGDEDHPGMTEIIVFIRTADLAGPSLYAPVDGEVELRIS